MLLLEQRSINNVLSGDHRPRVPRTDQSILAVRVKNTPFQRQSVPTEKVSYGSLGYGGTEIHTEISIF